MQEENKHELSENEICSIIGCSKCGAYHLNYRYLRLHLSIANLNSILQAIYVYEIVTTSNKVNTPFKFTFGLIELTVYHTDYKIFKNAVEEAVLQGTELPASILQIGTITNTNKIIKQIKKD